MCLAAAHAHNQRCLCAHTLANSVTLLIVLSDYFHCCYGLYQFCGRVRKQIYVFSYCPASVIKQFYIHAHMHSHTHTHTHTHTIYIYIYICIYTHYRSIHYMINPEQQPSWVLIFSLRCYVFYLVSNTMTSSLQGFKNLHFSYAV